MTSRAGLLEELRRQREEREGQRQRSVEAAAEASRTERAALRIQRVFRGTTALQKWSEAEWRSLQKQVGDLEHLAELVRQRGQSFIPPSKVLLPLVCRAHRQRRRRPGEIADLCGRLAALVVCALRAPVHDAQHGLCRVLESAAALAPHVPQPERQLVRFSEALLAAVISQRGAEGAAELASLLDAHAWGQGRALQESPASRRLADQLLASALRAPPNGPVRYVAWRAATVSAIAASPGQGTCASPRLQGLVDVSRSWLRLATTESAASMLLASVMSIPRVAALLVDAQARDVAVHLPWSWMLRSFLQALSGGSALGSWGQEHQRERAKHVDRESMLIYASGNLWEIHARVGLPLEPLLCVQAVLTENLEISMLPGNTFDTVDETVAVRSLRQQLRHLADPTAISRFFTHALHVHPSQGGRAACAGSALRPCQRHCFAVARQELSPATLEALCHIYSTLILKARVVMRTATSGWGTQVFHTLANMIAFMEGGAVAKILWRFASSFYDWRGDHRSLPLECYHVLHVHATVLSHLLSVTSHDEFLRGPGSPLSPQDLTEYIAHSTRLVARLIHQVRNGQGAAAASIRRAGGGSDASRGVRCPHGLFLETFLEQLGRTLSQLRLFVGRQPEGTPLPPVTTWHAPSDVLEDFRQSAERNARGSLGEALQASGGGGGDGGPPALAERLLRHIPHSVPFEVRIALLRAWIQGSREQARGRPPTKITVRRTHLFEDGLAALADVDWRSRFQVVFVNSAGLQEQGQDAGGLFKEFWEKLAETAFNPDYGLFRATDSRLLFPNPDAKRYHERTDKLFAFLGLVISKAIFEGIVVEPCFAPFFLAKLLGRRNSYYDLQSFDPSLFANLQRLKAYDGNVADLSCSFVASGVDGTEVPLVPDGQHITVTNDNRFKYIYLLSDYKLNTELKVNSDAFQVGFQRLVAERWIRMFDEDELQQIISGTQSCCVDVDDLQLHTQHSNCSGPRDKLVVDFFSALRAMSAEQRVQVLRFVTSCSRTPLLGFGHLVPPFTVHKVPVRSDAERLPTASTCFNTLKLPTYSHWKVTKQKLLFVVQQGAGFELD